MKRLTALFLAVVMVFCLAACSSSNSGSSAGKDADKAPAFKVGCILVGDETEGYTKAHIDGIEAAKKALNLSDDQIVYRYFVEESSACYDTAVELINSNKCNLILSNSYGHQDFMAQAAKEFPDVTFIAMTGDFAAISGNANMKNAFTEVYESRYVSGVVAGMKIKELVDAGKLTDKNYTADGKVKVGYVGAFNYAEVVSGYTAFYLGLTSVYPDAAMTVDYTSSWFSVDKEAAMAEQFIADGCVIIGQHADSTGAPSACQKAWENGTVVYSVGYNVDMLNVAPDAALTSAANNWAVYYTYAFKAAMNGETIKTDWAEGYDQDAVHITPLGKSVAPGTQEKVDEVINGLKNGSVKVFDVSTFTLDPSVQWCACEVDASGHLTSCKEDMSYFDYSTGAPQLVYQGETYEVIENGAFAESKFRSAPYFNLRIDGITELG